mgnify:FL=1
MMVEKCEEESQKNFGFWASLIAEGEGCGTCEGGRSLGAAVGGARGVCARRKTVDGGRRCCCGPLLLWILDGNFPGSGW